MKYKPFKKGQLVRCGGNAVLVTGKGDYKEAGYSCFAGVVVMAYDTGEGKDTVWPVGMYSETWNRRVFKRVSKGMNKIMMQAILKSKP